MSNQPWIHISTELPGPKSLTVLQQDQRFVSPSYSRPYPLVAREAQGMIVTDMDGNRFLDFSAGIATCSTGHCHPRIVRVIQEQAASLIHMSGTDFYYPQLSELAQKLAEVMPGNRDKKVYFGNSGAEAIEAALKLARYATGRHRFIAFYNAFHGRTYGALSLTASKTVQRRRFGPFLEGVTHLPFLSAYRCPHGLAPQPCSERCMYQLEEFVFKQLVPPEEVAGIMVEPIQGEGGYVVPPRNFLGVLKETAERYGILLIADEVQTGMGRTGKMLAMEQFEVVPDIIVLAKGIASGLPLGAIVASSQIMTWPPGSHASTFGGNPISCAAALETIRLLEEGLMRNAEIVGKSLKVGLESMAGRHPMMGDIRGFGLMLGIELVKDRSAKQRAGEWRDMAVQRCFRKGLLLLGCGENTIRLMPPLIVNQNQADTALEILDDVLCEIEQEVR
ncbi:MAG: acetyl ornithine aminotransferase family protein [Terriglobia bacterium]